MRKSSLVALSFSALLLSACNTIHQTPKTKTRSPTSSVASQTVPSTCPNYPVVFTPDTKSFVQAEKALNTLISTSDAETFPTLEWEPKKGTLISLKDLKIPLENCTGDLNQALGDTLLLAKDLFQVLPQEWTFRSSVKCSKLNENPRQVVSLRRKAMGPFAQPQGQETFNAVVQKINNQIYLTEVFGSYLPIASETLIETLKRCQSDGSVSAITQELQSTTFPLAKFDRCNYIGPGEYKANVSDKAEFDAELAWNWSEDENEQIVFTQMGMGRLFIDEANFTPDLKASDAFCPGAVGFLIGFDAVTGKLTFVKNGIDCSVC